MTDCSKAWRDWREHPWENFLDAHPVCDHRESKPAGTAGLAAYAPAPSFAWSGWRYRIPGGPIGGQYHGFIAPDDTIDGVGWPAGHDETYRAMDNPAGLGALPWEPWDEQWGGIPLAEGDTVSDYVYRSTAEVRPRPNASGGVHTVRAVQTQRSPGYAIAPGNYKGISGMGALVDNPIVRGLLPGTILRSPGANVVPVRGAIPYPLSPYPPGRACPAWGCGPPRWWDPYTENPAPAPAPVVTQPPPPTSPSPAPVVPMGPAGSSGCATGQYRDAAGNCTSDWRNPYALYLPQSPAPAPTVSANTCPTGYSQDASGNCLAPGATPSGSSITDWLGSSTQIAGMNIPNYALAGVAALVAFKMFGGRR